LESTPGLFENVFSVHLVPETVETVARFRRFLQRLTLSLCARETFDFSGMLQRWQQVIGWTFDPYMRVCQALVDKDVAELNEGLRDVTTDL